MRQKLPLFFTLLLLCGVVSLSEAQERYLNEVFSSVTVTKDSVYGTNVSIWPIIIGQDTLPAPVAQMMDVYQPDGDTATNRPLIIFAHTGTFFPPAINGGPTGQRGDSVCVEFATRMAKKGFVVAVVSYRRGWNATSTNAEVKRKTILEAAYRGIQDVRMAVRYFRKNHAEDGNGWGINPDKVAMGGVGTGGYLSYGATYLKRFDQVNLIKFQDFTNPTMPVPYVDTLFLGDPYGVKQGFINIPNYPTYSSDFNMGFAIGGALGDSSWIEAGDAPFVSLHCYRDPLAPYAVGDVLEPVNNDVVIAQASGGFASLTQANAKGTQDIFKSVAWNDPFTAAQMANPQNNGLEGLYSFVTPDRLPGDTSCVTSIPFPPDTFLNWGSPWDWFNEPVYAGTWNFVYAAAIGAGLNMTGAEAVCRAKRGAPNDPVQARMYIDTIVGYLTPRIAIALELQTSVSIEKDLKDEIGFQAYPNPSQGEMILKVTDPAQPIEGLEVFDLTGRRVFVRNDIRAQQFTLERGQWAAGVYVLKVRLKKGFITEKVRFD